MNHTPAPWTISTDFNNPAHEDKVCSIKGGEDDFFIAEICGDQPNQKDDARLIAAAPELLEALNSFPMLLAPANTAWGKQVQDWQETALAAIAKATGGAQ